MCGLFGCITKQDFKLSKELAEKRNAVIRGLALAMERRGNQSTGIAGLGGGFCEIYKKAVPAHVLVDRNPFQRFLDQDYNIILGHTRLATMGAPTEKNAHPYRFKNIVGTHNGQLYNWRNINDKVDVDSQAIFLQLKEDKNNYKKTFPKLYGSFNLAWLNTDEPNKLFLVSEKNPLHVIYVHQIRTYFYASEHYPLEAVVNTHFEIKKKTKAWATEPSKVYTINTKLQIQKEPVKFADYYTSDGRRSTYNTPYHSQEPDWQKPDYRDPDEEVYSNRVIPTYEERHGQKKNFVTHEKDHILLNSIEELEIRDMQLIVEKIEDTGCDDCHSKLNMATDEGFYWCALRNHILCLDCVSAGDISFTYLLWFTWNDYAEITEELDELAGEFA